MQLLQKIFLPAQNGYQQRKLLDRLCCQYCSESGITLVRKVKVQLWKKNQLRYRDQHAEYDAGATGVKIVCNYLAIVSFCYHHIISLKPILCLIFKFNKSSKKKSKSGCYLMPFCILVNHNFCYVPLSTSNNNNNTRLYSMFFLLWKVSLCIFYQELLEIWTKAILSHIARDCDVN